jgi:hypothetical protein
MERLMIRSADQRLVAPDDPTTVRPTVSKNRPVACPWRTIGAKMLDERPVIGRIGYRRHPSAIRAIIVISTIESPVKQTYDGSSWRRSWHRHCQASLAGFTAWIC